MFWFDTFGVLGGGEGPGEDVGGEVEQVEAVGDGCGEAEVGEGRGEAWENGWEFVYGGDDLGDWAGEVGGGDPEAGWTAEICGGGERSAECEEEKTEEGACEGGRNSHLKQVTSNQRAELPYL